MSARPKLGNLLLCIFSLSLALSLSLRWSNLQLETTLGFARSVCEPCWQLLRRSGWREALMEPCQHLRALVRFQPLSSAITERPRAHPAPRSSPPPAKNTGDKRQGPITQPASVMRGQEHMSAVKASDLFSVDRPLCSNRTCCLFGVM